MSEGLIFPLGEAYTGSKFFQGEAYGYTLSEQPDVYDVMAWSVTFKPKARNNWHVDIGGQILLVTEGVGYYQEKGKPIRVIKAGDVVHVPPNVAHWHGASVDKGMTHIVISTRVSAGVVEWMDPVTDEEFYGAQQ